jgi:hypothetical protein
MPQGIHRKMVPLVYRSLPVFFPWSSRLNTIRRLSGEMIRSTLIFRYSIHRTWRSLKVPGQTSFA